MKYIYWQDEGMWLGYLEEYPDYMTQGKGHRVRSTPLTRTPE